MQRYRSDYAVSPSSGARTWLVVDDEFQPHKESLSYSLGLEAGKHSPNTTRSYMAKIATFLNWCQEAGVDWRTVDVPALSRFKRTLQARRTSKGDLVTGKTVNIYLVAVTEFLKYCALHGFIGEVMAARFHEQRFLRYLPHGMQESETGSNRLITARLVKVREADIDPQVISASNLEKVEASCRDARELLLFYVLRDTAVRIGELLGLRREDLHFLPLSTAVGCSIHGPHLHVVRRMNSNGALAKSLPRAIPVTQDVVDAYIDFMQDREAFVPDSESPFVFINVHAQVDHRDSPMTYSNSKRIVNRWGREAEATIRPHMFRHTAATNWLRSGTPRDVVQELLGHASAESTSVYLHSTNQDARDAVDRLAAMRKERL